MRDHTAADALRVVLYSHDSVGLGHTRRNLAIAGALAAGLPAYNGRPVSGLLISGASDAAQFPLPDGWDWLLVPGITKSRKKPSPEAAHHPAEDALSLVSERSAQASAVPTHSAQPSPGTDASAGPAACTYVPRRLDVAPQRLIGLRSSVITGALLAFRPHLVIVDRHPFGADGELDEPLAALRRAKPDVRIVLGLREVLDEPATAKAEWDAVGIDRVQELYDELWVYGDRSVHDTVATGEIPTQLVPKTRFTGLLASDRQVRGATDLPGTRFVVTMVGGGADGVALARAAAAAPLPDGVQHIVATGPQMSPEDRMAVYSAAVVAGTGARVVSSVPDGLAFIRQAEAVIGMGGYNTVSEALSTDTPALIFPRVEPRTEQLIRARALGSHGAIDWLLPCKISPQTVGRWIAAAVEAQGATRTRQVEARRNLRLDGLSRVVEFAAGLSEADAARVRAAQAAASSASDTSSPSDTSSRSDTSFRSGSSSLVDSSVVEATESRSAREKRVAGSFGMEVAHVS